MPVYRIVLFRLKEDTTEEQKQEFINGSLALRGKVPGLVSIELGPPLDMVRTKGYDMGIILVLETKAHIKEFAEHPAHLALHDKREAMCVDSLAYSMEF